MGGFGWPGMWHINKDYFNPIHYFNSMAEVSDVSDIEGIYRLLLGGKINNNRGALIEITCPPTPASIRAYEKLQKEAAEQKDGQNIVFIDILAGSKDIQTTSILESLTNAPAQEISYFNWLACIWKFQEDIKNHINEGKVVFVKNYTYTLACTGISFDAFNLEEMKESMALAWCNSTFKGLMMPDMTFILTESLSYIEEYYQSLLTEAGGDKCKISEIGEVLDDPKNLQFHRSKLYVIEDTLQDLARLAPTSQMFPITNPALTNSIIFTFGMKWQDIRHKKKKLY